jgi:hypothetical protein
MLFAADFWAVLGPKGLTDTRSGDYALFCVAPAVKRACPPR